MSTGPVDKSAVNRIFGSDLPQESSDERDPEPGTSGPSRDEWLRNNVPPHHL